ncbi:MAG: hypothetical protein H6563_00540 [Lewinellaceae bacterium]|nr:hypothetical protein [Lewinellaceae bacterium]
MKFFNSILLACLFAISMANAQPVSEYTFSNGVKGIAFDSIELVRYFSQPDGGIRVFLFMKRTGAVQAKTGSLMSGGKEEVQLEALGVVDFSKDMKVVKEEVTFVKPKGAVTKEYNILAENDPARAATIATQEDCTDKWGLLDKYPELKTEEEVKAVVRPKMYYANSINYSMLGLKPKGFDKTIYTMKTEESEAEKGFLSKVLGTTVNYDKKNQSIDMDPYRNSDKKNYWIQASDPVCDPGTGMVYAHHGHVLLGEMGNRSQEFEQEFVVFDKEGKETARTEIKFEKPHALNLHQVLITETPADNLYKVDGIVNVYKQNYGFGYKKLNPEPDKQTYKLYHWNQTGELVNQIDFEVPVENVNVVRAFHSGDKVSVLATSYKPESLYSFCFEAGKLTCTDALDASHPIAKGLGFSPADLSRFDWKYNYSYDQKDGSKYVIYELSQEVTLTAQPGATPQKVISPKGYVMLRVDREGKLTHSQHIKRSENADAGYKTSFSSYPADNGNYLTIVKDPLVGGATAINVFQVSGATLEVKKIAEMNGAQELDVKQLPKASNMLFFSRNSTDQLYKLMLVSL